jgi:predicted TIM-barrel fold metal-dependent hydrolase
MTRSKSAPEPELTADELPLPLGARSNGEYFWPPNARERKLAKLILDMAAERARRMGVGRRAFLASSAGMATALSAVNLLGCTDRGGMPDGGPYDLDAGRMSDAGCDPDAADALLCGREFVFDVQTHHIELGGGWRDTNRPYQLFYDDLLPLTRSDCSLGAECFTFDYYADLVFAQSDTSVAVLSGLPALDCDEATAGEPCGNPIDNAGLAASRDRMNELVGFQRLVSHAMVVPNVDIDAALRKMQDAVRDFAVAAFKVYTPWGPLSAEQASALEGLALPQLFGMLSSGTFPNGTGFRLDDPDVGIPMIEKAIDLGVSIFCCHKGLPLPSFDPAYTSSRDLAAVATRYPAVRFVAYHSSYAAGAAHFLERQVEGPYDGPDADPAMAGKGVNDLVDALRDNDIPPNSNVYAELGGVWMSVMTDAVQAQHVIGKLLRHVGEDRILWGTDSIWNGSPQPQIEAFRALTITPEFQERYGYPALTDQAKAKILGLNAAALYGIDPVPRMAKLAQDPYAARRSDHRLARRLDPRPRAMPAGPRSRREYFRLFWQNRGEPG